MYKYNSRHTDNGGLQVYEDGAGHVLPGAGVAEEGGEGVVVAHVGLLCGHLAVGLDAVRRGGGQRCEEGGEKLGGGGGGGATLVGSN